VFAYYPDKEWLASSRFLHLGPEELVDAPSSATPPPASKTAIRVVPDDAPRAPVTFFPLRIALMS
jgi:hypothetical protein